MTAAATTAVRTTAAGRPTAEAFEAAVEVEGEATATAGRGTRGRIGAVVADRAAAEGSVAAAPAAAEGSVAAAPAAAEVSVAAASVAVAPTADTAAGEAIAASAIAAGLRARVEVLTSAGNGIAMNIAAAVGAAAGSGSATTPLAAAVSTVIEARRVRPAATRAGDADEMAAGSSVPTAAAAPATAPPAAIGEAATGRDQAGVRRGRVSVDSTIAAGDRSGIVAGTAVAADRSATARAIVGPRAGHGSNGPTHHHPIAKSPILRSRS
jgi:hypothetical protein